MLRVFVAFDINTVYPLNPYVLHLLEGLLDHDGVEAVGHGVGLLSRQKERWDVLHIQWPEALWGWRPPSSSEFHATIETVRALKARGTKVVVTVHNHEPQPAFAAANGAFFADVYRLADGFVHLGPTSERDFTRRYRDLTGRHAVIHHMDYTQYARHARAGGGADEGGEGGARVLVFGQLRERREEALAREAFLQADLPAARLTFAGDLDDHAFDKAYRKTLKGLSAPNIVRTHRRLSDADVDAAFRSTDFVFIPRADRLNSGVQSLAYSYDRIVIAPDTGVMGDLVRAAGGLLYAPDDEGSAADAIRSAAAMTPTERADLVDRIRTFRMANMAHDVCADRHVEFYKSVLSGSAA